MLGVKTIAHIFNLNPKPYPFSAIQVQDQGNAECSHPSSFSLPSRGVGDLGLSGRGVEGFYLGGLREGPEFRHRAPKPKPGTPDLA